MNGEVPIQRQGPMLIASLQASLSDPGLEDLARTLVSSAGPQIRSIVLDIGPVDVLDSHAARMLEQMTAAARLRGARLIVVGIRPEAAFAMVQLGLRLKGVETGLDLDDGLAILQAG